MSNDTSKTETTDEKKSILTTAMETAKAKIHAATEPADETTPKKLNNKLTFGIGLVTGAAAVYAALRIFTGQVDEDSDIIIVEELDDTEIDD